ncbi:hypothetical protein BSKO_00479 [Bryopsis sp. KO-2023]|nr:hypothetical protein BSKO_00479 [Bryopsis sp. KO-2023]
MNSAPRCVSWVIVLLFFTSSGDFGKVVNGLPCAPSLDCENTKCLTVPGLASCCTCISWDSRGACVEWESANGQQGAVCNFDVDMYQKTMTNLDSLGDDSCPAGTACEDRRCREVNGYTDECCMCTAWEKSGDCKEDGWRSENGDVCRLDDGQAPPTPMQEPCGCPPGARCEDTKCRNHNGSNTCCRCYQWHSNGSCKATGWMRVSGLGACDFSADSPTPVARVVPHYTVIPLATVSSKPSYRGQEEPATLNNQVVNVAIEKKEQNKADNGDNNMGDGFSSMSSPAAQNEPPSNDSGGDIAAVQQLADPNINANLPSGGQDGAVVQLNNGERQNGNDGGNADPTVSNDSSHNQTDGQSHKLRKLLADRKKKHGDCGLHLNCQIQKCYTMNEQRSCCTCNKWDGDGQCSNWVSSTDDRRGCTFNVSD